MNKPMLKQQIAFLRRKRASESDAMDGIMYDSLIGALESELARRNNAGRPRKYADDRARWKAHNERRKKTAKSVG
ncbi:MAG: hypothetical protein E6Q97_39360 [Desulfurellales bacterium]|nr:MAG: hypothetical protein E6Q97_39360 [Desulfurellales bacterium]